MGMITKNGKPTTKTKGFIRDIYIDSSTNERYKCTFAYIAPDEEYYEWKKINKQNKEDSKVAKNNNQTPTRTNYTKHSVKE